MQIAMCGLLPLAPGNLMVAPMNGRPSLAATYKDIYRADDAVVQE